MDFNTNIKPCALISHPIGANPVNVSVLILQNFIATKDTYICTWNTNALKNPERINVLNYEDIISPSKSNNNIPPDDRNKLTVLPPLNIIDTIYDSVIIFDDLNHTINT